VSIKLRESRKKKRLLAVTRWCVERRKSVFLLCALVVLTALPGMLLLDLRLGGLALVPKNHPALTIDAEIKRTFAVHDHIVLFVDATSPSDILRPQPLRLVRDLTLAIAQYEGIEPRHLMSLATEGRDRLESFNYAPFLFPLPQTDEEIASLWLDIEAARLIKGTLVAADYSGAAILVRVPDDMDRQALYLRIKATVVAADAGPIHIHIVGAPVAEVLLGEYLLKDLARLLPLCVLLLSAVLLWAFRRPWAILVILMLPCASLVFTFGMMGWAGQPVYITTAILPVVLSTIAIASEVHLMTALQRSIGAGERDDGEAPLRALAEVYRPLVLAALTTAIGFASFIISPLDAVKTFGFWAVVGIIFNMAWSLCVTPSLYSAFGAERLSRRNWRPSAFHVVAVQIARASRYRWTRPAAVALLVLISAGTYRLEIQDSWIDSFAQNSDFRASIDRVNRALLGTHMLQMHLRFNANVPRQPRGHPDNRSTGRHFASTARSRGSPWTGHLSFHRALSRSGPPLRKRAHRRYIWRNPTHLATH